MRKRTYERMLKKVHEINENPLSIKIKILATKPLAMQTNYNSKLREWFGPKEYDVIVDTTGIMDAFKESEDWKEIGNLGIHDYKVTINDNLNLDIHNLTSYMAEVNNKMYNIVFYREFIGEVHIGIRPLVS